MKSIVILCVASLSLSGIKHTSHRARRSTDSSISAGFLIRSLIQLQLEDLFVQPEPDLSDLNTRFEDVLFENSQVYLTTESWNSRDSNPDEPIPLSLSHNILDTSKVLLMSLHTGGQSGNAFSLSIYLMLTVVIALYNSIYMNY